MQDGNILFQVLPALLQNPLLEIHEIERVLVTYVFVPQPTDEVGEVISDLPPVEYSVYHVTAKQTHLYLVSEVTLNFFVFVNCLENVRCS